VERFLLEMVHAEDHAEDHVEDLVVVLVVVLVEAVEAEAAVVVAENEAVVECDRNDKTIHSLLTFFAGCRLFVDGEIRLYNRAL